MTASVRALILTAAVAATLAACQRREEKAPAPAPETPAAVTPADAAAPMAYETKTPFANVKLSLPDAVKSQPDLHARLYAQEVRDLRQFVEGAQGIRTEAGDDPSQPPYEKTIGFTPAAETDKLFSLKRTDFDYSGGAHPNTVTTGLLWDKSLKRQITPAEFFVRGADFTALDRALCAAANAAKKARDPSAQPVRPGGDMWACPKASETAFVLTPGTTPGKAGGLTFLVGPYVIGPYSDGAYELAIPQSVFRALIAPAYADQFEGQPVRSGDVTPPRS